MPTRRRTRSGKGGAGTMLRWMIPGDVKVVDVDALDAAIEWAAL